MTSKQELAELRVKYKDFSIMGKHTFPELTLITEDREYEPNEEITMKLLTTKRQRQQLTQCHPGVGFLAYYNGVGITEVDFYIGRKDKQLYYISNGKPVEFEVFDEEQS